jgi:hypothetical protein
MSEPRVLILSQRAWNRWFHMPLSYEFEDTIAEVDSADILAPPFRYSSRLGQIAYKAGNWMRGSRGRLLDPGIPAVRVERDYDLFFAILSHAYETPMFLQLKDLRRRCRKAVCMFVELWTSHCDQYRRSLDLLRELEFDHVFLHHRSCLRELGLATGRPCSFLPLGVDCLRFTPEPGGPVRSIDCYSMGRRSETTHRALLEKARDRDFFYLYDTVGKFTFNNWLEHRLLTANLMKRTRYFLSYKPALRTDSGVNSDESLAARNFEGAAGGVVALGIAPGCSEYAENFDWPDATIPIPWECFNAGEVIAELDAQPERLERVRRNNMAQALLRHDWAYRWESILRAVAMAPEPALAERKACLAERAARHDQLAGLKARAVGA